MKRFITVILPRVKFPSAELTRLNSFKSRKTHDIVIHGFSIDYPGFNNLR